jgi:methyl-accepting chemotaxis protein
MSSNQPKSADDVIKELNETLSRHVKETEKHIATLQQSAQQLAKLSEELKKMAQELSKPILSQAQQQQGKK